MKHWNILDWFLTALMLFAAVVWLSGCTMGRGAFAGLNPVTWLKPSTYIEIHKQHEHQVARTNVVHQP